MKPFDLIVMGCSAGGIEALKIVLGPLRSNKLPPVVIVQHRGTDRPPLLVSFFNGFCKLPVKEAESKEPLQKGHIYFAPGGYHLLISDELSFDLTVEEPVNFSRPSINVLFESVACIPNINALGVVMTGANGDGALGLKKIVENGGQAIVQNPKEALFSQMPQAALNLTPKAKQLDLQEIGRYLLELSSP